MLLKNLNQLQENNKIFGIGVDIVQNSRINKLLKNKNFIKRIYSNDEIKKSNKIKNKIGYFSKRFAAKEALMKAIGTGFRHNVNFKDISVINNKLGKPEIKIMNNIKKELINRHKLKKIKIFLSLSDEKNYSIAFVIVHKYS